MVQQKTNCAHVSIEFGEIQKLIRLAEQAGNLNNKYKLYFHVKNQGIIHFNVISKTHIVVFYVKVQYHAC